MLILAIIVGLLIGLARSGRAARLADFKLRFAPLIIVAFLIQGLIPWLGGGLSRYRFVLLIISYLMLLTALLINSAEIGLAITGGGVFLNFVVILLNGGMPVSAPAARAAGYRGPLTDLATVKDGVHVLLGPSTRLSWLADIIPLPLPSVLGGVASPGDLLMIVGVAWFIQAKMVYAGKRRVEKGRGRGRGKE